MFYSNTYVKVDFIILNPVRMISTCRMTFSRLAGTGATAHAQMSRDSPQEDPTSTKTSRLSIKKYSKSIIDSMFVISSSSPYTDPHISKPNGSTTSSGMPLSIICGNPIAAGFSTSRSSPSGYISGFGMSFRLATLCLHRSGIQPIGSPN